MCCFSAVDEDEEEDTDLGTVQSVDEASTATVEVWADQQIIGSAIVPLAPIRAPAATGQHHSVVEGWRPLLFRGDPAGEVYVRIEEVRTVPSSDDAAVVSTAARLTEPLRVWVLEGT